MQSNQSNKELLTEVSQAFLHHISKGTKTLQKSGKLRLFKLSETEFEITLEDFVFSFNTETGLFFKTTNGTYSSYFFTPDKENLYAITVDKYQGSTQLETQINKLTEVFSYEKAKNYELFQKLVEQNYPNPNIPLLQGNKVNRYIEQAGGFLGNSFKIMGGWSASAVNYVGEFVQSKISPGEMSDSNRRKVDAVTEKSKSVTDVVVGAATTISKPIAQTGADLGTKLSSTLQSSEHASVRRMNDIGATSIQATGTAWKGFWDGLCTFSNALKTQSTNIWNKKFNSLVIPETTTINTQEQNLVGQK